MGWVRVRKRFNAYTTKETLECVHWQNQYTIRSDPFDSAVVCGSDDANIYLLSIKGNMIQQLSRAYHLLEPIWIRWHSEERLLWWFFAFA